MSLESEVKIMNYFETALKNYIENRPNKKECFYCHDTNNNVNYKTLFNFLFTDSILCNNIVNVDCNFMYNNVINDCDDSDDSDDSDEDFYQYYIVEVDTWRLEQYKNYIKENNIDTDIYLFYSDILDCYICGVSHFGTSWDYVPTDIKIEVDKSA